MPKIMLLLLLLFTCLNADAQNSGSAQAVVPVYSDPIDENAHDKDTCLLKWDRYHRSQDCLAPFHNVNGSWKPGAFEHCAVFPYPGECPIYYDLK